MSTPNGSDRAEEDVNESSENAEDWEDVPTWPRARMIAGEGEQEHVRDNE
jgi:hypothetical protein